jgi:uncharacterized protein YutD
MIYEPETLRKIAQEVLNSDEAKYYLSNMKENWHGFSVEEKKKAIMLDNLRSVLTDRVFNVVSGTYLEIGSRKGIYADLSGEIELKELFDNTETYLCEGCELGICLFTLVRAENKYKLDFSESDPIYDSFGVLVVLLVKGYLNYLQKRNLKNWKALLKVASHTYMNQITILMKNTVVQENV